LLSRQRFTAILYEVPDNENLRSAIKGLAHLEADTPIVVVSCLNDWDTYLAAMASGAFDYIDFPPYPGELERILCLALSECKAPTTALAQLA
jgi:DNA-binding NtrC family response regulator